MNQIAQFIADLVKRLFKPTPKFFNVFKVIGLIAAAVGQIPNLVKVNTIASPWNIILTVAGITVTVVSQLTVKDSTNDPTLNVK